MREAVIGSSSGSSSSGEGSRGRRQTVRQTPGMQTKREKYLREGMIRRSSSKAAVVRVFGNVVPMALSPSSTCATTILSLKTVSLPDEGESNAKTMKHAHAIEYLLYHAHAVACTKRSLVGNRVNVDALLLSFHGRKQILTRRMSTAPRTYIHEHALGNGVCYRHARACK